MRSGVRIGRVSGIDIRVDWSWFLIVVLVTWNFGAVLGGLHPAWGPTLRWGIGLTAAMLLFMSVLAHELAHSLLAQSRGLPVGNITLFLFGGVSGLQHEPESPRTEFWMALVGPVTSLVVGAVLLLLAGAMGASTGSLLTSPGATMAQLSPFATVLLWLGSTNLALGFFNLIPGFPLDGGRVLRSILWTATGSLRRATRWAAGVGQTIAWLMIMGGVAMAFGAQIPYFGSGLGSGLWLAFIGWFLQNASAQSYQQVVIHDILDGVQVTRVMRRDPPTVSPGLCVSSLVHDKLMGTDECCFPVMDDGHLAGLVTLDDVRKVRRDHWETTSVRDVMTPTPNLVTVTSQADAAEALTKLAQNDVRQLPVLQGGALVGMLRRRDIVRWLQLHAEEAR